MTENLHVMDKRLDMIRRIQSRIRQINPHYDFNNASTTARGSDFVGETVQEEMNIVEEVVEGQEIADNEIYL